MSSEDKSKHDADYETLKTGATLPSVGASRFKKLLKHPGRWIFITAVLLSLYSAFYNKAVYVAHEHELQVTEKNGKFYYPGERGPVELPETIPYNSALLHPERIQHYNEKKITAPVETEFVHRIITTENADEQYIYKRITLDTHYGLFSLLPAVLAILLAWVTREPLSALLSGIIAGSLILGRFDFINDSIITTLASENAATILVLYLWLLGGLLGIWARTGAAAAFAEWATRHFVRGPRSAKFTAWLLGMIFFQGGTMSTVLVGTTVRPIADREKISHEELSYIVDSTASPVAVLLAFNAWPVYIQSFLFVPGVAFLATEADRIRFFFHSVPLSFYAIFAVTGTLLLSLGVYRFAGRRIKEAAERSRKYNWLNRKGSQPLSTRELETIEVPSDYHPAVADFFIPLMVLLSIALGSFILTGSPEVVLAFAAALATAVVMALLRGMQLYDVVIGAGEGFKSVVSGSVILLLALTIGSISSETGAGVYLVEMLGDFLPYYLLPLSFLLLAMGIAFSTGTSFGTFAVTLPIAMPLAWAVAGASDLSSPYFFMSLSFAAVLNGSVYGDQCSPISDTTILSSMATGADLIDHVKSQIHPATIAAAAAGLLWTLLALAAA